MDISGRFLYIYHHFSDNWSCFFFSDCIRAQTTPFYTWAKYVWWQWAISQEVWSWCHQCSYYLDSNNLIILITENEKWFQIQDWRVGLGGIKSSGSWLLGLTVSDTRVPTLLKKLLNSLAMSAGLSFRVLSIFLFKSSWLFWTCLWLPWASPESFLDSLDAVLS